MKKILPFIITIVMLFSLSACRVSGTERYDTQSLSFGYNRFSVGFELYGGGTYAVYYPADPDTEIWTEYPPDMSFYRKMPYAVNGTITKKTNLYTNLNEDSDATYQDMVTSFLDGAKAASVMCVEWNGEIYGMLNVYKTSHGSSLYIEEFETSYYVKLTDKVEVIHRFDDAVVLNFNDRYAVIERDNCFFSYDSETDTETQMFFDERSTDEDGEKIWVKGEAFTDNERDSLLNHANYVILYFDEDYILFQLYSSKVSRTYCRYVLTDYSGEFVRAVTTIEL